MLVATGSLTRKSELLASLPDRVRAAPLHDQDGYMRAATRRPWNNARLMQFKVYNQRRAPFERLLSSHDGDIIGFMDDVARITEGAADPFEAVAQATSQDGGTDIRTNPPSRARRH